jgi:hypothetical protein
LGAVEPSENGGGNAVRRPAAKAGIDPGGVFVGLKPHANPKVETWRLGRSVNHSTPSRTVEELPVVGGAPPNNIFVIWSFA